MKEFRAYFRVKEELEGIVIFNGVKHIMYDCAFGEFESFKVALPTDIRVKIDSCYHSEYCTLTLDNSKVNVDKLANINVPKFSSAFSCLKIKDTHPVSDIEFEYQRARQLVVISGPLVKAKTGLVEETSGKASKVRHSGTAHIDILDHTHYSEITCRFIAFGSKAHVVSKLEDYAKVEFCGKLKPGLSVDDFMVLKLKRVELVEGGKVC